MDVLKVKKINGMSGITPIPNMPKHILGMMNLRGTMMPVIDLRVSTRTAPDPVTVVTVRVQQHVMGLLVDSVSQALAFRRISRRNQTLIDQLQEGGTLNEIATPPRSHLDHGSNGHGLLRVRNCC